MPSIARGQDLLPRHGEFCLESRPDYESDDPSLDRPENLHELLAWMEALRGDERFESIFQYEVLTYLLTVESELMGRLGYDHRRTRDGYLVHKNGRIGAHTPEDLLQNGLGRILVQVFERHEEAVQKSEEYKQLLKDGSLAAKNDDVEIPKATTVRVEGTASSTRSDVNKSLEQLGISPI